jgi:hypothetical protein
MMKKTLIPLAIMVLLANQSLAQEKSQKPGLVAFPPFEAKTPEEAEQWRKEARAAIVEHHGLADFIKDRASRKTPAPLNAEVYDTEDYPDYKLLMVKIDVKPGWRSPIYVSIPKKGKGPFPTVFPHVGYKERAYPETKKVRLSDEFGQRKPDAPADLYARSGFVTVGVDLMVADPTATDIEDRILLPHSANPPDLLNNPKYRRANLRDKLQLGLRVIDYLKTRPEVDKSKIVFNGGSRWAIFGAEMAAFEPSIRLCVLEVAFDKDRFPLVSPRPLCLIFGRQDRPGSVPSEQELAVVRERYKLLGGKDEDFEFAYHPGGHKMSPEIAIKFIKKK